MQEGASDAFNLGNGTGFSVQQVIDTAQRVTGRSIPVVNAPRRAGDPAVLVADGRRARENLGWVPAYPDLQTIIAHAWAWEQGRA
jgi:UDP-glucose 4-epimerase